MLDLSGQQVRIRRMDAGNRQVDFSDNDGAVTSRVAFACIEQIVICFTLGTRIATIRGEVLVERLWIGDRVLTRDNGPQDLRWIGCRRLGRHSLQAAPKFEPVLIRRGALGANLPEQDMMVSPNHRMPFNTDLTALLFEEREVLVAAKHLVDLPDVERMRPDAMTLRFAKFG